MPGDTNKYTFTISKGQYSIQQDESEACAFLAINFFKRCIFAYVHIYVFIVVSHECRCPRRLEDGVRSSGTEVMGSWEPPAVNTATPAWVFHKRSMGSYPLSHLSGSLLSICKKPLANHTIR